MKLFDLLGMLGSITAVVILMSGRIQRGKKVSVYRDRSDVTALKFSSHGEGR